MAERAKKRPRWPWLFAAALLVLVCNPIAWQFRPLNTTERALVGTWRSIDRFSTFRFDAARRYRTAHNQFGIRRRSGQWNASAGVLRLKNDPVRYARLHWIECLQIYFHDFWNRTSLRSLRMDGPDRAFLNDVEFVRVPYAFETDPDAP